MARLIAELKIPTVSPHDLRRTVGTELARLGLPVHVRSLVLNHSPMSRGITDAVYNRYAYDNEKREALEAWEARLALLIETASDNTKLLKRNERANAGVVTDISRARSDVVEVHEELAMRFVPS
jgi:hypothetical protein